jgi:hypothetical protein
MTKKEKKPESKIKKNADKPKAKRACGSCGKTGHNARTCGR